MPSGEYLRYVALGDSQTEGLGDGDDITGLRGWADRLAEHLAAPAPGSSTPIWPYGHASPARSAPNSWRPPSPCAPTWPPSSPGSTTCCGPGSTPTRWPVTWRRCSPRSPRRAPASATVTFPDVARITPLARPISPACRALNHRIRAAAGRHGWSSSRLATTRSSPTRGCGAPTGCTPTPSGTRGSPPRSPTPCGLPGQRRRLDPPPAPGARPPRPGDRSPNCAGPPPSWGPGSAGALRGRSSGDGRTAKRPNLLPLQALPGEADRTDNDPLTMTPVRITREGRLRRRSSLRWGRRGRPAPCAR